MHLGTRSCGGGPGPGLWQPAGTARRPAYELVHRAKPGPSRQALAGFGDAPLRGGCGRHAVGRTAAGISVCLLAGRCGRSESPAHHRPGQLFEDRRRHLPTGGPGLSHGGPDRRRWRSRRRSGADPNRSEHPRVQSRRRRRQIQAGRSCPCPSRCLYPNRRRSLLLAPGALALRRKRADMRLPLLRTVSCCPTEMSRAHR